MTDFPPVSTEGEMIAVLRARKDDLGLSNAHLDHMLNRANGFTDHYLGRADKPIVSQAWTMFCEALAIEFIARTNLAAAKRMESRWEKRNASQIRVYACRASMDQIEAIKPLIFGQVAQSGGFARAAKLSPNQRSRIARRAARARWRKPPRPP